MNILHIFGNYETATNPRRLEMREEDGTIYLRHGGNLVSLTFTDGQAQDMIGLLTLIKARGGFREMEE